MTVKQYGISVGMENMEGNGVKGFATPLATLHKFQGWADKFLATPPNGIEDKYVNLSANFKAAGGLDTLGIVVSYHDYEAERIDADYGSEINVSLAAKYKKVSVMLKFADYDEGVLASARNTQKLWMQVEDTTKATAGYSTSATRRRSARSRRSTIYSTSRASWACRPRSATRPTRTARVSRATSPRARR